MAKKFLLFFLVSLLSGCLNYTQITTIKKDNTGKMFVHYWYKWEGKQDSVLFDKMAMFSKDSLENEFTKSFTEINYINVYRNFADSTLHSQMEFEFTALDSLNQFRLFRDNQIHTVDNPGGTVTFTQHVPPFSTYMGIGNEDLVVKYVYYFPGKITDHNGLDQNENKITWEFHSRELTKGSLLSATYIPFKLKETPRWIYIFGLFVLVVVIVYLFKRR